jgi:hypothetical protein
MPSGVQGGNAPATRAPPVGKGRAGGNSVGFPLPSALAESLSLEWSGQSPLAIVLNPTTTPQGGGPIGPPIAFELVPNPRLCFVQHRNANVRAAPSLPPFGMANSPAKFSFVPEALVVVLRASPKRKFSFRGCDIRLSQTKGLSP